MFSRLQYTKTGCHLPHMGVLCRAHVAQPPLRRGRLGAALALQLQRRLHQRRWEPARRARGGKRARVNGYGGGAERARATAS